MKPLQLGILVTALGLGLGLGYSLFEHELNSAPKSAANEQPQSLDSLPAFSYQDLQNNLRSSHEWQDKIVVLNF